MNNETSATNEKCERKYTLVPQIDEVTNDIPHAPEHFELIQAIIEGLRQNLIGGDVKRKEFIPNDFSMKFT